MRSTSTAADIGARRLLAPVPTKARVIKLVICPMSNALVVVTGQVAGTITVEAGARVVVRAMVARQLLGSGTRVVAEGAFVDGRALFRGGTWRTPIDAVTVADRPPLYELRGAGELVRVG